MAQTGTTKSVRARRSPASIGRARRGPTRRAKPILSAGAARCRAKFLRYFPKGFSDPTYVDWERGYKWQAHERRMQILAQGAFAQSLKAGDYRTIAAGAVAIEARTNLLFSFEKMAVRDAIKSAAGAKAFAEGLYAFLHGDGSEEQRYDAWCKTVAQMPRRQTRVLTWPVVTVFGFVAQPRKHIFLKPTVTRIAARKYGFDFDYRSRPNWQTYSSLLLLARAGVPLKIAAKIDDVDREYWMEIAPMVEATSGVDYIGEINEEQKEKFLGNARALLFPSIGRSRLGL